MYKDLEKYKCSLNINRPGSDPHPYFHIWELREGKWKLLMLLDEKK